MRFNIKQLSSHIFSNHSFILIVPVIYLIWGIYLNNMLGPGFLTNIDPEYAYLLNGLNCADLNFDRIGHVDNPGTPFQILTGIFIWIIYLISGNGSLTQDVISRPDFYLSGTSFLLSLLTAYVIYWLGKQAQKQKSDLTGIFILQITAFTMTDIMGLATRYNPDRLLIVFALIFSGLTVNYLYNEKYTRTKFAIQSGIVMGIAIVTKFNFFPMLAFPLFLFRKKKEFFNYGLFFILFAFISFLPIIDKFDYFWNFISSVFTHDGLYGKGDSSLLNANSFLKNIGFILYFNTALTIILVLILASFVFAMGKPQFRKKFKKEYLILFANISVTAIGFLAVAKHFKNYYLIPELSLSGLSMYILLKMSRQLIPVRIIKPVFIVLILIFISVTFSWMYPKFKQTPRVVANKVLMHNQVKSAMGPHDYLFIEPLWIAGPLKEYGLVFGISYVAKKHLFYNDFEKVYPNVLTWEGENNPIKHFRMEDANMEKILKGGNNIFLFSSPGRNAEKLLNHLNNIAKLHNIGLAHDTILSNKDNNKHFLKIKSIEYN